MCSLIFTHWVKDTIFSARGKVMTHPTQPLIGYYLIEILLGCQDEPIRGRVGCFLRSQYTAPVRWLDYLGKEDMDFN